MKKKKSYYLAAEKKRVGGDIEGCYRTFLKGAYHYTRVLLKALSPLPYYDMAIIMLVIKHILNCMEEENAEAAQTCRHLEEAVKLKKIGFRVK